MANVQYYDVILKPVITEKSMADMATKKYTLVKVSATNEINTYDVLKYETLVVTKAAVEKLEEVYA